MLSDTASIECAHQQMEQTLLQAQAAADAQQPGSQCEGHVGSGTQQGDATATAGSGPQAHAAAGSSAASGEC